jgi:DNA polymerase III alpha subunit (gram-positive type)
MLEYYVLDLETTGLKAKYNEVSEISIIRCKDKMQLNENVICIHPERASYDALKITGKTLNDLKYGKSKQEVVEKCNRLFNLDNTDPSHRCIIGHNIWTFDKKFLHALWEEVGSFFPADLYLDTLSIMKEYKKKHNIKTAVNLHASCDLLKIKKFSEAHSAKFDTRNNYLLYKELEAMGIDFLPFIKNDPHKPVVVSEDDYNQLIEELYND